MHRARPQRKYLGPARRYGGTEDIRSTLRHGFQKSGVRQITKFWPLRRLLGTATAPSFSVRLTRERCDGTDGMRPCGRPDRLD